MMSCLLKRSARKSRAVVLASALIVGIMMILCSCGESIMGTWYYIPDPSEDSTRNLVFKDSKTMNYDMVDFDYKKAGDEITVDVSLDLSLGGFGVDDVTIDQRKLTLGSLDGCRIITEDDDEKPKWAQTLEEAEKLHEKYYG